MIEPIFEPDEVQRLAATMTEAELDARLVEAIRSAAATEFNNGGYVSEHHALFEVVKHANQTLDGFTFHLDEANNITVTRP